MSPEGLVESIIDLYDDNASRMALSEQIEVAETIIADLQTRLLELAERKRTQTIG